ncbi:MAG: hypothetical protein KBE30_05655, partial [Desulfobacter sp.]|nr:hypothetical protein [Desulfobacter sp.]
NMALKARDKPGLHKIRPGIRVRNRRLPDHPWKMVSPFLRHCSLKNTVICSFIALLKPGFPDTPGQLS